MTRFTTTIGAALSLAAVVSAFVLPESAVNPQQRPLHGSHASVESTSSGDGAFRWLDNLPLSEHSIDDDDAGFEIEDSIENVDAAVDSIFYAVEGETYDDDFSQAVASIPDALAGGSTESPDGEEDLLTIYQHISRNKYTTKFAQAVDQYPSVVKLLNSTSANYTLFVPIDDAFRHIPDDHKQFDKEFIEDVLHYHIGLGEYSAGRILSTYTIPTAYDEKWLGGDPQRLRTSVNLAGIKINFYSKVVTADIKAKNGIIHAVNNILVPPPMVGRIITLFPSRFSTLLLAYEKTDFVKFIHAIKMVGSTVFVPTNEAFAWLGPRANAFLFNTEKGLKYLKAILKYHVAPNATLYTDAFYDRLGDDSNSDVIGFQREHYDLPTLLGHAHISVDIARIFGFATMKVNGFAHVSIPNGVAKNGVIQVVDQVPLPPCKNKKCFPRSYISEIEVEDLVARLEDYV